MCRTTRHHRSVGRTPKSVEVCDGRGRPSYGRLPFIRRPHFAGWAALLFLCSFAAAQESGEDGRQARGEARKILLREEDKLLAAVTKYREVFEKAAKVELAKRRNDRSELQKLREDVSPLLDAEDLTEELINEVEPKFRRLERLLTIDRETVLAEYAELSSERAALARKFRAWENALARWNELATGPHETLSVLPTAESLLAWHEQLATQLAIVADEESRKLLLANVAPAARLGPQEAQLVNAINQLRILLGRRPLKIDLALSAASRDHSHAMRTGEFFSHESPVEGKKLPQDRARHFGSQAWAENIAWGSRRAEPIVDMWFHSPPHLTNMIAMHHRRVGVGRSETFWTLMLGTSLGW